MPQAKDGGSLKISMENAPSFPARKPTRLQNYDYSQNGCYFVTVCAKDRRPILSTIVGDDAFIAPQVKLTEIGKIAEKHIQKINLVSADVTVEKYIIMPDHMHLLLFIDGFGNGTMKASSPTNLSTVIRSLKTFVTRDVGKSIWQCSFYDEIIKNETHFQRAWEYTQYNALKEYGQKKRTDEKPTEVATI